MRLGSILAVAIAVIISTAAVPAFCDTRSVWGIPAGSDFETVSSAMAERGCSLIQDISTLDFGKTRDVLYRGEFFGRPCSIEVVFESDAMKTFRFGFIRKDDTTSGDGVGPMLGNYSELTLKLRSKYGYDRKIVSHGGGETQTWTFDGMKVILACDGRSKSGHTTTLTYSFEEGISTKP